VTHDERPDIYVEEELRQALATDPRIALPDLLVRVTGGKVIVTGSVPTDPLRRALAEVVGEVAGDLEFDDQTIVGRLAPGGQEEDLR
jgi:osmotically-inducible protein OsmY